MDLARPTTFERRLNRLVENPRPWFLAAALLTAVQIGPWWYASPDGTSYMSIARTLWSPAGPTNLGNHQLYFSPGYPTLISPAFTVGDRPFVVLGLINWLLTMAVMWGAYRWARAWGPATALVASVATVLHAIYGISMRRPLSETAFMAAMIWTVIVLDGVRTAVAPRRRWACALGGTLLLTVTCLTRPNGVMIIPGFGLAMLAAAWGDRSRVLRAVLVSALIGGTAATVFLTVRTLDDRRASGDCAYTYWDQLFKPVTSDKSLVGRIPEGTLIQMCDLYRVVVPGMYKSRTKGNDLLHVNTLVALVVTAVAGVGWLQMARGRGDVWTWTFPCYLALNVVWGADVGTRYTLPVMPVVWAACWLGFTQLVPRVALWAAFPATAHAIVGMAAWLTIDLPRTRELNRHWNDAAALCTQLDADAAALGSWALTPEQTQLFRFLLDRDVTPLADDVMYQRHVPAAVGTVIATTSRPSPAWVVADDRAPTPSGYVERAVAGPYRLLHREDAAEMQAARRSLMQR